MTNILKSIYYGSLNKCIIAICDTMQTLLLFSPVVALFSLRKNIKPGQILPALAALGFFLIYLVWESKSQYTLQVFVLFLVYMGPMMNSISDVILRLLDRLLRKETGSVKSLGAEMAEHA